MAEKKLAIRLGFSGQEQVSQGFRKVGTSANQATPPMRALDSVSKDVRSSFDGLANRIPVVGGGLKALGPAGVAAGAAIAGVAASMVGVYHATRQAMQEFSRIGTAANALSLARESLMAIEAAALENGVAASELTNILMTMNTNVAKAAYDQGRLGKAIAAVNPEILTQLKYAKTTEDRWNAVASAVRNASHETERQQIVTAAFGVQGLRLMQVLRDQGSSIEDLTAKGRELGLVLDEDLIKTAHAADDRLNVMARTVDLQLKVAMVGFIPIIEDVARAFTDAARSAGDFFDSLRAPEDRNSLPQLVEDIDVTEMRLRSLKRELDNMRGREDNLWNWMTFGDSAGREQKLVADFVAAQEKLLALRRRHAELTDAERGGSPGMNPADEISTAWQQVVESAKTPLQKAREELAAFNANLARHPELAGEAAQVEAILVANVRAAEQAVWLASDAYKAQQAEIKALEAVTKRWTGAVDGALSPVEKARGAIDDLTLDFLNGKVAPELYTAAMAALTDGLADAEKAAREATPEFKAVAEARDMIARAAEAAMSKEEKIAAKQAELNALVGEHGFTAAEAAAATEAYAKSLDTVEASSLEVIAAQELMEAALAGQINSWEDLGEVAARVMVKMVMDAVSAKSKMGSGGSGSLLDFAGDVFGSIFGGGKAPVAHSGGVIGDPGMPSRVVSLDAFRGARRMHSGGEVPIIAQQGERMFSRMHNERIVRAVETGAGGVTVNIINQAGAQVETRERKGPDGSRHLDVMLSRKINDHLGAGGADKALNARFGLRPQARG